MWLVEGNMQSEEERLVVSTVLGIRVAPRASDSSSPPEPLPRLNQCSLTTTAKGRRANVGKASDMNRD